jgi:hypothetical protein
MSPVLAWASQWSTAAILVSIVFSTDVYCPSVFALGCLANQPSQTRTLYQLNKLLNGGINGIFLSDA